MLIDALAQVSRNHDKDEMGFSTVLTAGNTYKLAGLTPIYCWDEQTFRIAVYAEELVNYLRH